MSEHRDDALRILNHLPMIDGPDYVVSIAAVTHALLYIGDQLETLKPHVELSMEPHQAAAEQLAGVVSDEQIDRIMIDFVRNTFGARAAEATTAGLTAMKAAKEAGQDEQAQVDAFDFAARPEPTGPHIMVVTDPAQLSEVLQRRTLARSKRIVTAHQRVPCPRCHAQAGEPCRNTLGGPDHALHTEPVPEGYQHIERLRADGVIS